MLLNTAECKTRESDILSYIPLRLSLILSSCVNEKTEEIRLRAERPLTVKQRSQLYFVSPLGKLTKNAFNCVNVTRSDIETAISLLCNSSLYAYEDEIKNGYITLSSGHRIGLCGSAVTEKGKITFINNISGLNYRIAHEIKGFSEKVIDDVLNNSQVRNTLIISPPGSGKTTLLRDLARAVSNSGKCVCILDERGEIAAVKNGIPGFDIGMFSDVLTGCSKSDGIELLLRSMSPDVIVTDELGGNSDISAVTEAQSKGVSIIATMHATNKYCLSPSLSEKFNCIITLSSRLGVGTVEEIIIK